MPAYQFHFDGALDDRTPARRHLPDLAAAKSEAAQTIGAMVCDAADRAWDGDDWSMTVTDHSGVALFSITVLTRASTDIRPLCLPSSPTL